MLNKDTREKRIPGQGPLRVGSGSKSRWQGYTIEKTKYIYSSVQFAPLFPIVWVPRSAQSSRRLLK